MNLILKGLEKIIEYMIRTSNSMNESAHYFINIEETDNEYVIRTSYNKYWALSFEVDNKKKLGLIDTGGRPYDAMIEPDHYQILEEDGDLTDVCDINMRDLVNTFKSRIGTSSISIPVNKEYDLEFEDCKLMPFHSNTRLYGPTSVIGLDFLSRFSKLVFEYEKPYYNFTGIISKRA